MKIICIGRNYGEHIRELNNEKPEKPVIFLKPDTAWVKSPADWYLPAFSNNVHYECELVLKIGKEGKSIAPEFAHRYIESVALGIDFTCRDLQDELKSRGLPWERAKSFDASAVTGNFIPYEDRHYQFQMTLNGKVVQNGNTADMIFSIPEIIADISSWITLKKGDLIFTGTPAGVGSIAKGDTLLGYLETNENFVCRIS